MTVSVRDFIYRYTHTAAMESSEDIAVSSSGERVPCLASPHNDSHYKFAQVKVTNTIVGVILFLTNVLSCASGQRDPLLALARSAAKALPGFTFRHLLPWCWSHVTFILFF